VHMKLSLEKASVIVDRALAKAREAKYRPMCIAVLDDGGCLKALKREDGASILRPNIAIGKAWGAVGMGESSPQFGERVKVWAALLGSLCEQFARIGTTWGAVGMGESSRQLGERLKERPAFLGALSDMSGGKVVPVAGGVLIMDGNEIIGAVGITGGTSDE